jgi:quercetin dioxygenase-like cupin family protein
MTVEDETIHMPAGEVWWFDKHALHSVENGAPTAST